MFEHPACAVLAYSQLLSTVNAQIEDLFFIEYRIKHENGDACCVDGLIATPRHCHSPEGLSVQRARPRRLFLLFIQ
jgi:hypothetical protein